jgi:AcrR family transcriptional regulator
MPRTPRTARDETPDRILDAALELFNAHGTAAVSTNRIAAQVGISPGNLYYWFANKAEIVRALYTRYAAEHLALWEPTTETAGSDGTPAEQTPSPADLAARMAAGAAVTARHAFLARELVTLVHGDPGLAADYREVRAARLALFGALARAWRRAGLLRDADGAGPDDATLADAVEALWVVSEAWYPFAALDGEPEPAHGAALVAAVVRPWLRDARTTPDRAGATTKDPR